MKAPDRVLCPDRCEAGVLPVSTFDPRPDRQCPTCEGSGYVDADDLVDPDTELAQL